MLRASTLLLEIVLLTGAYWLVDHAFRRGTLEALLIQLGLDSARTRSTAWVLGCTAASWTWRWSSIPDGDAVRVLAVGLGALLAWKASTKDIDVVTGIEHRLERGLVLGCVAGSLWSPAWVVALGWLLTRPFALWQHHATLPMRLLQGVIAFVTVTPVLGFIQAVPDARALFFLVVTMQASHYLITALAKSWLGPHWYSWVVHNRVDHLAASAYSWGWARFVPWVHWRRVIAAIRVFRIPMQAGAYAAELLAPLALLDHRLAMLFALVWSAFHVGVFVTSGLLFWDWIGANLVVALALTMLPTMTEAASFGGVPLLLGVGFMVAFPLRHKLFAPMPLGWWDTPFTQRMVWIAHGRSGQTYGLYNNFMCPHERLYGKVHACFMTPHPVCTYHLGEVYKVELRDALRDAGPDLARLDAVRERFGIMPRDEAMTRAHRRYLQAFFDALNRGAKKHVLPRALRWLKAPGGQVFYWGELESFRGQEPVERVSLRYREEYFDGERLVRLRDELVEEVPIVPVPEGERVPEPPPKAIDQLLLQHANGKLIDLPDFGGGYVHGDDGAGSR